MITAVVWPYDDCHLFENGDIVFYTSDFQWFWDPMLASWAPASRKNIKEDTCSQATLNLGTLISTPPMGVGTPAGSDGKDIPETGAGTCSTTSGGSSTTPSPTR